MEHQPVQTAAMHPFLPVTPDDFIDVAIRAVISGAPSYLTDSPYRQQHEHISARLLFAQITEHDARSRLARMCIIRYLKGIRPGCA